jgi:catechol 2,3-dioxygenase-like lactoylglutathione lyase family enzyme
MLRTGFIDHIGIGVPDLAAAKRYYDELMPILGLRAWFPATEAGEFNYGPAGARGSQVFFYQALQPGPHSRHGTGLQHLSFMVSSRASVRNPTASCSRSSATRRRDVTGGAQAQAAAPVHRCTSSGAVNQ